MRNRPQSSWLAQWCLTVGALCFSGSCSSAQSPLANVQVFPPDINLETARDRQSFVVQATYGDGISRDVTGEAKATFANAALIKLDGNVIYPVADGTTEMKVEFGGKAV